MKGKHCSGGAGLGQAVRSRWLDTKDEVSGIHAIQYVDTRVDIEDTRVDIEDTRVDIEATRVGEDGKGMMCDTIHSLEQNQYT